MNGLAIPNECEKSAGLQSQTRAARTSNAMSLDASEKERLLELRYTLILLSAHTNSERAC